jgi:hypothetical protein
MTPHDSPFVQVRTLIRAWVTSEQFTPTQRQWLEAFRGTMTFQTLPETSKQSEASPPVGWGARWRLRLAVDALDALASGELSTVHSSLTPLLDDAWLEAEPLEGSLEQLGVWLARQAGDAAAEQRFLQRFEQYTLRFPAAEHEQLSAGWAAWLEPGIAPWLDDFFLPTEIRMNPELYQPSMPGSPDSNGLDQTKAYRGHEHLLPTQSLERSMRLHVLRDSQWGEVHTCIVVLRDRTTGTPLGRIDASHRFWADLEFVFDQQNQGVLEQLEAGALTIRLMFSNGRYWDFGTADGTLSTLDSSASNALGVSLELPRSWLETDVPLSIVLADIDSALLIPIEH